MNDCGFKLISYQTNFFIGDFKKQMESHKWKCFDVNDHMFKKDWDSFNFVSENVFKDLENEEKPFVIHIANADCHVFPKYFIDPRCKRRLQNSPRIVRSFDCVDQIL